MMATRARHSVSGDTLVAATAGSGCSRKQNPAEWLGRGKEQGRESGGTAVLPMASPMVWLDNGGGAS